MTKEIEKMSFEEALNKLENITKQIDTGDITLEMSISQFDYCNKLAQHCQKKLDEAKLKIDKISLDNKQNVTIEEVDNISDS